MRAKTCLRTLLRPEILTLVIVPTIVLVVLACCGLLGRQLTSRHLWTSIIYLKFFGWRLVYWVCIPALGYLLYSAVAYAEERKRQSQRRSDQTATNTKAWAFERFRAARSCAWLVAASGYALAVHLIAMNAACLPSRQRVVWANELLMRADHALFGTYVPFEMQEQPLFHAMSTPLLFCYQHLSLAIVLVLIALWMFNQGRFRQYLLAFLTVTFIALPGWFALPATTPSEAYRLNKLGVRIPLEIGLETAAPIAHLDRGVFDMLDQVEPFQSVPLQGRFFITSLPSMHVAWGILVVWFGAMLHRRLALILIPWGLFNCIGAVFTLQHYAVDAVAGAIVAVIAVYCIRGLIAWEDRAGLKPPLAYGIFDFVRRDAASLAQRLWPFASRPIGENCLANDE
ncbi:MAG: phosphatase PAP2 family protein [Planctomycetaceae bacterium]|nr:phosphatase PAP2 family protein [Planctomycetaceae bacterium]